MKLGLQTIIFGPRIDDLERTLAFIAEAGFEGVEFAQHAEHIYVLHDGTPTPVTVEEMWDLLDKYQLELLGLAGGSLWRRILFVCAGSRRPAYFYVEDCTAPMVAKALNHGCRLALHSHVFKRNKRPQEARDLLNKCPDLLWLPDSAHLYIAAPQDVAEALRLVSPDRIPAVHLKDWDAAYGRSYHRYAKGFTELGLGNVPLGDFLSELNTIHFDGWLVLEQDYANKDPYESIRRNVAWTLQNCPQLKRTKQLPLDVCEYAKDNEVLATNVSLLSVPGVDEFTKCLLDLIGSELSVCYDTIAKSIQGLVGSPLVTIWTCNLVRDHLSLVAASPYLDDLSEVVNRYVFLGRYRDIPSTPFEVPLEQMLRRATETKDHHILKLCELAYAQGAVAMFGFPVINKFNGNHVRFFVATFEEADGHRWESMPHLARCRLGRDMASAVDSSLDDLCAYASGRVSLLAGTNRSLRPFLTGLCKLVQVLADSEGVTVFLQSPLGDRLYESGSTGMEWLTRNTPYYDRKSSSLTVTSWVNNEPILSHNALKEDQHPTRSQETIGVDQNRHNVMLVPLVDTNGKSIGVIRCRNKRLRTERFTANASAIRTTTTTAQGGRDAIFTDDAAAVVDVMGHAAVPHILLLQSDKVRMEAVGKIKHEIAFPADAIKGAVSWLKRDFDRHGLSSQLFRYDYPGDILSWSELLIRIIGNADLYALKDEDVLLETEPTLIMAELIAPAVRQVDRLLVKRRFKTSSINYGSFESVPRLHVDKNRMQQVVFNLLSNSIKYARSSPEQFKVEIDGINTGRSFDIRFRDWGLGIDEEHREAIFGEGVRGPFADSQDVNGQGLGLWIARRVVRAHGGEIYSSQMSGPTEFIVSLPVKLAYGPPPKRSILITQ